MIRESATTSLLLRGLLEPANETAWTEFDGRYRPMILACAQRLGMSPEDAADVAQDVLVRFIKEYREGKYDPLRGRLGAWIVGIVRFRVADHKRAKAARREARGESAFDEFPTDNELNEIWETERKRVLLRQAIDELRATSRLNDKTIEAFERFALQQHPAQDVADSLGLTVQDVYMAKNRVAARLREILDRLEHLFDDR